MNHLVKIKKIQILENYQIYFLFDDGTEKIIDFKPYIKNDPLTSMLADVNFFNQVKVYENGRGIYWPNDYDFCPDTLRYYIEPVHEVVNHN